MAFLDFIKNRNASRQQTVAQKAQERELEYAPEHFRRLAAREKAQLSPVEQIPEADRAAAKAIGERIDRAQPAVNAPQIPESAAEQSRRDRVLAILEKAQRSRFSATPNQQSDAIDPERLARAERFVDASARPKREEPPPMRWPRQRGSWER
jgi:hypothetical protein